MLKVQVPALAAQLVLEIGYPWCENPTMNATAMREKRQLTLPKDVSEAAGLKPGDEVDWRFEDGEIRGRKLKHAEPEEAFPRGSLARFLTPQKAEEELALLKGCSLEVPE